MSSRQDHPDLSASLLDAERQAVRRLLATQVQSAEALQAHDCEVGALSDRRSAVPVLEAGAETGRAKTPGALAEIVKSVAVSVAERAKSYRPKRKRILWTSLVLILLLYPFFVLGCALVIVTMVASAYLLWGGDTFWRRVIAGYQRVQQCWPGTARQIKVRAFVLSKKWDRFLAVLPDRLADQLRGPDLRQIIAADARHDVVMSDRLTRLDDRGARS
ncbi:MAG: hypothetical protein V2I76_13365 [Roseobacter sp.]|nr:hypothetical protein [Roseobacter sp.]